MSHQLSLVMDNSPLKITFKGKDPFAYNDVDIR